MLIYKSHNTLLTCQLGKLGIQRKKEINNIYIYKYMLLHVLHPKPSVSPNLLENLTRKVPLEPQQET